MKGGREPTGFAGDLSSANRSVRENNPTVRTEAWPDPNKEVLSKRKVSANSTRKSTANSSGKKRSSSRGPKKHGHRSEKRGHGKSCPGLGISIKDGLDNILEKLRIKLTEGERNRVEGAMKKAGKGKGGCNTVAVKKLFDGEEPVKNKAMIAYNKLKDGEGIKSNLTQGLKRLADGKITKADKECLDMPDESLEKNDYCKNSNNPQVKSRLDKLKANLQSKIKEDQAKIAKQAEEKAERDRQRQMKTNNNRKIKKCVNNALDLAPFSAKLLPIKPEHKVEDIEPLLADVSARYDKLKQECDQFKKQSSPYNTQRLAIQSNIASMQSAIRTKTKELEEKKEAAKKAKQEEAFAAKNLENARIEREKAEEDKNKKDAAKKAKHEEAFAAKKLAVEVENKRLAEEAKKKTQKEKLEAEAAEKKRLAAEAQDKREKELAEKEAETARLKVVEAEKQAREQALKAEEEKKKKQAAEEKARKLALKAEEVRVAAEEERKRREAAEEEAKKQALKAEEVRVAAEAAEKKSEEEAIKLKIEAEKKLKIEAERLEAEKKKEAAEAKQNEERERLEAEKLEAEKLEAGKEKEAQTLLKTAEITLELKLKGDALEKEREINKKNTESLKKIESELRSLKKAVDKNSTAEEQKILKSLEETIKSWITHKVK